MQDEKYLAIFTFLGFVTGFAAAITFMIATGNTVTKWRAEAVERGHAEYYLDEDNNRQWRWKECDE